MKRIEGVMKVNELRIGNLVHRLAKIVVVKAIEIDNEGLGYLSANGEAVTQNQVEPIPLTEEWLLKAGFEKKFNIGCGEKDPNAYYWQGKKIDLTLDLELSTPDHNYDSISVNGSMPLKYLHQLQNLYYTLTGEEIF
jgi:hypothetical protein